MKILAMDSSGLVASAAIVEDGIMRAEYTINYNHTNSFYQEQVNYLIHSLPHLLPMISLKKLQQQYHYSTLLLSCVIHYIQFLHDTKYYDQAFSLSFFIIQHSLYDGISIHTSLSFSRTN